MSSENKKLNIVERLQLLEALCESTAANPEDAPLTPAQCEELERRLEADHQNRMFWPEVRKNRSGKQRG